jgi:hypothetical protein
MWPAVCEPIFDMIFGPIPINYEEYNRIVVGPGSVKCEINLTRKSHPEMYVQGLIFSKLNYNISVLMVTHIYRQYILLLNEWIITIIITEVKNSITSRLVLLLL